MLPWKYAGLAARRCVSGMKMYGGYCFSGLGGTGPFGGAASGLLRGFWCIKWVDVMGVVVVVVILGVGRGEGDEVLLFLLWSLL